MRKREWIQWKWRVFPWTHALTDLLRLGRKNPAFIDLNFISDLLVKFSKSNRSRVDSHRSLRAAAATSTNYRYFSFCFRSDIDYDWNLLHNFDIVVLITNDLAIDIRSFHLEVQKISFNLFVSIRSRGNRLWCININLTAFNFIPVNFLLNFFFFVFLVSMFWCLGIFFSLISLLFPLK